MTDVGLVDTHAHLMDPAFDADRDGVLARARAAGVTRLVLVGYDRATSQAAVELTRELPGCGAAVGIHPNSAAEATDADFAALAALARAPEVVAIGETGLDYYRQHTPHARQRESFRWHLRLARELGLPVIVHNRLADSDVASAAESHSGSGVLHCFSSTDPSYLERMLDLGYFVSFAGPITFKNAEELRSMAARVPHQRVLVETDCPYLAPMPHRGDRNEPAFVRYTAICVAEVLGVSFDAFVERLWTNTLSAFAALGRRAQELTL
jgi:TatD DNase family protein